MNTIFEIQFDLQRFEDTDSNINNAKVSGTTNNDIIKTTGEKVSISALAGNDRIYHTSGKDVTIEGDEGRETIFAYAENAYINGGAENDLIRLDLNNIKKYDKTYTQNLTSNSKGATIIGGAGNDTIYANGENDTGTGRTFVFGSDDGADVIYGIKNGDIISLSGGASLSSSVYSGEDFLLTIGDTKVLLKKPETENGFEGVELKVGNTQYTIPSLYQGNKNSEKKDNTSNNIVLDLLGGNDSISNSGSYVTIYGGAGADTIVNTSGSNVMLDGGAGNDSISVSGGSSIKVEGGAGADTVQIDADVSDVTVTGGAGNDYFKASNSTGNVYIYTEGDGKDTIEGYKAGDTISVMAGIIGEGEFVGSDFVVNIGKGSLTFKNINASQTPNIELIQPDSTTTISVPAIVQGTKNAETLTSSNNDYSIDAGAGNDAINVSGGSNTVLAGAGNDTVNLNAGSGGANVSVGAGNDVISIAAGSGAHTFVFGTADGSNTINGLTSADILSFGTGTVDTAISADGNNFLLTSGKTTVAVADYFSIAGTQFTTMQTGVENSDNSTTIPKILQGTKNNDSALTLSASYNGFLINALGGNDTIDNGGKTVTIDGGDGADKITNTGTTVEIYGDAGNDKVTNSGGTVTIDGGDGNDTITNSGTSVTIAGDKGNDSIINSGSEVSISGGDGVDTITNTGDSVTIDGGAGVDEIVNSGNEVSIFGGEGNDKISLASGANSVTINGGKGNDSVTVTGASNLLFEYESGDGNDDIYGYGANNSITIGGDDATFKTDISGTDFIITVVEGKTTGKTTGKITLHDVVGTVDNTTINGKEVAIAKVLQGTSGDDSIDIGSAAYRVEALAGNDTISIAEGTSSISVNGGTGDDYIIANNGGKNFYIYAEGDGNDTIQGFTADDTIHITEGKLESSVVSDKNLILNVGKGSIVLESVIGSVKSAQIKIGESALETLEINLVKVGTTKADDMLNEDDNYMVSVGAGNDTVENYGKNVVIEAGAGKDYIFNSSNEVTVSGDKDNDTIESFGSSVSLYGGDGVDYIYSDGENNFVGGGAGNDTIEIAGTNTTVVYNYGDGTDTVYGFTEDDTLNINAGEISGASVSGTDVILKIGSGSVKLMDMAGKSINYAYDAQDATSTVIRGEITGTARADKIENTYADFIISALAGNDTVENSGDGAVIDGGTGADSISNSAAEVSITGGTGNDIISSSGDKVMIDGGQGHDKITIGESSSEVTVTGGKGNDTITTTGANVVFNYASGDGKDVIVGFSEGDSVKFSGGTIKESLISGETDAVLEFAGGSVTFKNVAADKLTVSGNTVTHKVATGGGDVGNMAVPWFAEEDTNFIGGDATVDEITTPDYSVTKIETTDEADAISHLEKYIAAYGSDK